MNREPNREPTPAKQQMERLENALLRALEQPQDGDTGQHIVQDKDAADATTGAFADIAAPVLDALRNLPAERREILARLFGTMIVAAAWLVRALAAIGGREKTVEQTKPPVLPTTDSGDTGGEAVGVLQVSPTVRRRRRQ